MPINRKVKYYDYISAIVIFFIFIFGPLLNSIGSWADVIFIFSIFIFCINIDKLKQFKEYPYRYFYLLIFLFTVLSLRTLVYPSLTLEMFLLNFIKPFRVLFTLYAGYFIASYFYKKKFKFSDLLYIIYISIILNSIIILFQFINIDFRDFIYSYTTTGEFRSTFEYDFRMGGLTGGSGGAILSTVQSLGIIITPFLLVLTRGLISRFLILIGTALILVSIILTGRSGIYCILLFLPFSLYYIYGLSKSLAILTYLAFASIFLFLFVSQIVLSSEDSDFYFSFYRTFDSFISLSESGKYENETVEVLKGHILFPDFLTLIFGSNEAMLNYGVERKIDSDIGYVRNIYSYGLFGIIIFLIPFVRLTYYVRSKMKISMSYKLLFILLVIMAFFHLKESYMYVRMFWSIISLILGFIVIENYNIKSKERCAVS